MRQMREANKARLDTWRVMRVDPADPRGRFDSHAVTAHLYADYVAFCDRQSNGIWVPVHRRTFDVYVKSHVKTRRGRAIGWALKPVDTRLHRC